MGRGPFLLGFSGRASRSYHIVGGSGNIFRRFSFNLRPQVGLSWDLGDAGALDQVSFRVPKSKFVREVLKETGPLAIASAAFAKQSPIRRISDIFVLESALAAKFDAGLLKKGALSTVLEADNEGITMVREGAISLDEIHAIAPEVSRQLS